MTEHVEILLEEIKGSVQAVAEGHIATQRKMEEMKAELKRDIKEGDERLEFAVRNLQKDVKEIKGELKEVRYELGEVSDKVDRVERKLDEHALMPAHV